MAITIESDPSTPPASTAPAATSPRPLTPYASRLTPHLFLLFLGCYLLTTGGHLYAVDEETLFRTTESLVERGTLALPRDAWGLVTSEQPSDGALYSQYQPGQPLAAIPFYLVGKALAPLFPAFAEPTILRFAVSLFGAFVTAATVALLYRLGVALGYRERTALIAAAIYGLATTAWPYARTFYTEPLTALCLLAAFHALRRGTAPPAARGWLVWGGVAAGLALFVKPHAALVLPFLGLYLLGRLAGSPSWSRDVARRLIAPALLWGGVVIVAAIPFFVGNALIYGGPLRTGYSVGRLEGLAYPFFRGLYGLLLSPGKGVAWYSPPLILALLAARPFYRAHRAEALTCLGIALTHLAFYSRLTLWNGDWAWGPRYLVVILPFMYLPLLAFLDTLGVARWRRPVAVAVIALGVGVQLLGVLANPVWPRAAVFDTPDRQARVAARFFSPPASPLVVHARMLAARLAEWRDRVAPPPDTAILAGGFAAVEGRPDQLFPRWTDGAGRIALHSGGPEPLTVKLTFFDHRPADRRESRPMVLVNGTPLPDAAIERNNFTGDSEGWTYGFTLPPDQLQGGRATITLQSAPWNPRALGVGDRDESLGLFVHNVEIWRLGQPWPVRDDAPTAARRTIPPLPVAIPALYSWFNADDPFPPVANGPAIHHPIDHWAWYLAVAGLPRPLTLTALLAYAAFAATPLLLGLTLLSRILPAENLRHSRPSRPSRRRAIGR